MSDIEVTYDGPYNVVVECTGCGTERGSKVIAPTKLRPGRTHYEHCKECGGWRDHEPIREAERGEYDSQFICDDCDERFDNTMDVDLHDCPADSENDEDDEDDPVRVTDGGEDQTAHVTDRTVEDAIAQHDDPEHPDATTVEEVRDLLATLQTAVKEGWYEYMDHIEDGTMQVVAENNDLLVLETGEHAMYYQELTDVLDMDVNDETMDVLGSVMHELAREHSEYDWGYAYPLVVRKPDGMEDGQRYVESVVNGLQRKGLTPGQAWAYYGVEIRGQSRNSWGLRKGDHDHKNVSDALEKAKQKLPEA